MAPISPDFPAQADSNSSREATPEQEQSSQRQADLCSQTSLPVFQLPEPVKQFFMAVPTDGFPTPNEQKDQPWKKVWKGPAEPTEDGKLLVACPKICKYGSNNLGGL